MIHIKQLISQRSNKIISLANLIGQSRKHFHTNPNPLHFPLLFRICIPLGCFLTPPTNPQSLDNVNVLLATFNTPNAAIKFLQHHDAQPTHK